MSVHDQEDFARVYDEDEVITIRKGDLRALLDIASTSLDFGSGFLNDEEVEILRAAAVVLGVDPMQVTPSNHHCKYAPHVFMWTTYWKMDDYRWRCQFCQYEDLDRPPPANS
jgi:hypothetical protein